MKKESLYLDTSVPSAYFDERAKERQNATIKFWNDILPDYHIYVSEITIEELENTKSEELRVKLVGLIKNFKSLKSIKKIKELAKAYIDNNIFSTKYFDDAHHVAIASFHEITYLISWNYEHLVKVKTRKLVNSVNILKGFKEIEIISPQEL